MKKLNPTGLKYLKIIHLICAIIWIGGAFALIFNLCFIHPTTPEGLYICSLSIKLIDDLLIIPGAIGLIITGVIYGIWSNWGFFKYRWITVKWVVIIAQTILGIVIGTQWVNTNVYPIENINDYLLNQEVFIRNVNQTILWGTIQTVCLIIVIWISVIKPWKKKKYDK